MTSPHPLLHRINTTFFTTLFSRNVVLVQAVGLCPIILAGTTLQQGVALTVCTLAVLLPVSLLMSLVGERLSRWLRPALYTLVASVLMVLAAWGLEHYIAQSLYAKLYIFLPLMAINTLFTYRAGSFSSQHGPLLALVDALASGLGFGLVICVVSALRELAGQGTLWGIPLGYTYRIPAELPFVAFLLLAFMAAALQWAKAGFARAVDRGRGKRHE